MGKGNDEKQTVSKTQETVVTEEKVEELKAGTETLGNKKTEVVDEIAASHKSPEKDTKAVSSSTKKRRKKQKQKSNEKESASKTQETVVTEEKVEEVKAGNETLENKKIEVVDEIAASHKSPEKDSKDTKAVSSSTKKRRKKQKQKSNEKESASKTQET